MNVDIENIEKIENIYKHYKKMEENLPNYTTRVLWWNWHFPDKFLRNKKNVNKDHNIPNDVKNNIKRMAAEQGLYAKVVMLRQKNSKITKANKNINEDKFKF